MAVSVTLRTTKTWSELNFWDRNQLISTRQVCSCICEGPSQGGSASNSFTPQLSLVLTLSLGPLPQIGPVIMLES